MQIHMQADGMKARLLVKNLFVVTILITLCFVSFNFVKNSKAEVLPKFYVDDDYDSSTPGWGVDHFNIIQYAIDNASADDRILIYEGTYNENLNIDSSKSSLDLFGEDRTGTIINGGGSNDVIIVSATGVDISTLTIKNSGSVSNNSVVKINAGNCVITDCTITNGQRGIFCSNCNSNIIYYNTISSNDGDGIYLNNSDSNEISYNTINSNSNGIFLFNSLNNEIDNCVIQSNSKHGLFLNETCNSNTIINNNISSNSKNGIYFDDHCNSNTLTNNEIYSNSYSGVRLENSSSNILGSNSVNANTDYGIMIVGSSNSIHNSTIQNNGEYGVLLFGDDLSNIADNTIHINTKDGIRLQNSTSDIIVRNTISRNQRYGVYLNYFSVNNYIYDNKFLYNSYNARDINSNNNWYISSTQSTNIVGGSYISGNFWSDYDELSEGAVDSNNNGIADSPLSIEISNFDNGALIDTTLPVISSINDNPDSQTQGSYTNISSVINDNVELKVVRLVVTNPNGVVSNFSIIENNTGSTYYCNKQFLTVGDYIYQITAKDSRNWAQSDTGSFSIHEGSAPTITDNSQSTGSPASLFTFNATIVSGETSASNLSAWVIWSHDSLSGNTSMVNTARNYFENAITLDGSVNDLTYHYYAKDQWGNKAKSSTSTADIIDTEPPEISIIKYRELYDNYPNSYIFKVKVEDQTDITRVYMNYWYNGSEIQKTEMDNINSNYYQKIITPNKKVDKIFCVIFANDTSNNQANTKKPYSINGGPYSGYVVQKITFNGSESFDLDGNITKYYWDFGDGYFGEGKKPIHSYSASGTYTVKLTVTDNDENTNTTSTYIIIGSLVKKTPSTQTLNDLETEFNIQFNESFYGYDTDGDGKIETFVDPNNIITLLHSGYITINNHAAFLLSINEDIEKIFLWDTEADIIINVSYQESSITNEEEDKTTDTKTITIKTKKAAWTYIESTDKYPESSLTIKRSDNSIINSGLIWRKNNKIYFLDDPDTTYYLIYSKKTSTGGETTAIFTPSKTSKINKNNPTIILKFSNNADILYAVFYRTNEYQTKTFWSKDITSDFKKIDSKTYSYTPPADLEKGKYRIELDVKDENGQIIYAESYYYYEPYEGQQMQISLRTIIISIGIIIGLGLALHLIFKRKNITLKSFIYFKNKKIIPFFKPVIFGPLKIKLKEEKISKAEFYVNGKLKHTIDKPPYNWTWNEPAFLKQNIETKIYDENGNINSSGEMTFYMFNPTKPNK